MKIIKTQAKEIFTKTKLPGANWVINQYVGCEHNCSYCYAKFISRWKKHGQWGSWVEAKINAPDLVKDRRIDGYIFMSSISDAYQPVEKELKLTRDILQNMDKSNRLGILTKSNLILRDIDLLKQFKKVEVGLTINGFEGKTKKQFEPGSISNDERILALFELKKNGISTYAFISPIIPGLIDLEEIIKKTKDYVDYYWFEFLNLKGAGKEFIQFMKDKYPINYAALRDKSFMAEYKKSLEELIKNHKIKIKGIEQHN